MKSCKHREQRIDSLLHSCPVLCTELGLQGLARLATTSSGLRGACQSILNLDSASWLASSLGIDNKAQRLQAAAWVLWAAPAGAANAAQVLLSVPELPLDSAEQLVSAGARVSYAQLLAAAHSMVAGVEVWVQAQRQLGIPSDIPAAAEAICCSKVCDIYVNWVSQVLLLAIQSTCALNYTMGRWRCCYGLMGNMMMMMTMVHAMQCMVHGARACADTQIRLIYELAQKAQHCTGAGMICEQLRVIAHAHNLCDSSVQALPMTAASFGFVATAARLQPDTQKEAPAGAAVADLLQLAMNSSSHTAAEAAAHHIPAELKPEVARKLLTTVALRKHVSAVQHMAGLAVMQQHVDATALQCCLQQLIVGSIWHDYSLFSLINTPQHKYNQLHPQSVYALPAQCLQQHC
jgi:hypothetical protein